MERVPDVDVTKAKELIYKIAYNEGLALQVQRDIVDLGKSLADLEVANTVDYKLEEMRKRHEADKRRMQEAMRAADRVLEQQRARELQQMREKNQRIQGFQRRQLSCQRNVPFGKCDGSMCYNKLKHYTAIFRKFSSRCLGRGPNMGKQIVAPVAVGMTIGTAGLVAMIAELANTQPCIGLIMRMRSV